MNSFSLTDYLIIILLITFIIQFVWMLVSNKQSDNKWFEDRIRDLSEKISGMERHFHELQKQQEKSLEKEFSGQREKLLDTLHNFQRSLTETLNENKNENLKILHEQRTSFDERHSQAQKQTHDTLTKGMESLNKQVADVLTRNTKELTGQVEKLTEQTQEKLKDISGQVEKRLNEGFEKTTATFTDVVKRLALIDEAQKKITELSTNVVSLQEVLSDKTSRGAFGEVQLSGLIRNVMPENSFSFQHTLSNDRRADCVLFLPDPTGTLCIDSKFPLESYRRMHDQDADEPSRKQAASQFKQDVKKHIKDISEKYIINGETADGAMMFIPAEAIFAEIHGNHPDLVEFAHQTRVWMVSPTTMMAVLNTARAVIKDAATRQQVNVIQDHLHYLSKDFERFEQRMDDLAKHIGQANSDVEKINISAKKISSRFGKIERVELDDGDDDIELLE